MAAIGLLLVILGVIGEGVFEGLVSINETKLRAHDEQVLGETIKEAGTAKQSADDAARAAELASAAAGEAMRKADAASKEADSAGGSATTALTLAGDAKAQVGTVQTNIDTVDAKYAPRTLSKIKREILIDFLTKAFPKPKDPIEVMVDVTAPDGMQYAKEIVDATNSPSTGFKAKAPEEALGDGDKVGVFLVVRELASPLQGAVSIQQALKRSGIGGDGLPDGRLPPDSPMRRILVCKKN